MSVKTKAIKKIDIKMETTSNDMLKLLGTINDFNKEKENQMVVNTITNEIKQKVEKHPSMNVLNEEVLEDGSVVITISA